jgi:hypothetical protein
MVTGHIRIFIISGGVSYIVGGAIVFLGVMDFIAEFKKQLSLVGVNLRIYYITQSG